MRMKMKENAMKNTIDDKQKGQLRIRGVASILSPNAQI